MKRVYVVAVVAVFAAGAFAGVYLSGDGSAEDPYQIARADDWEELINTSGDWGKHFILLNDIDLSGRTLTPVGNGTTPFSGVFDGNGHVIRNALINLPGNDEFALFGYLHYPGKIRDFGVEDLTMTGRSRVGGLLAVNIGGEIIRCHATGTITVSKVDNGGLVGFNYWGTILSSYTAVSVQGVIVSGCGSIGGLAGYNRGTIQFCYAAGPVTGHGSIGGLVGNNVAGGRVSGCYASGLVTSDYDAGGLVGQNSGIVSDSYATGTVASKWHVGGLVGWDNQGKVLHCYSIGKPTGISNVGGFCGLINTGGDYEDVGNFWDTETSLLATSGMGTGMTTAEMRTKLTFEVANWDFVGTWGITENVSYPYLRPVPTSTTCSADFNCDGKVDLIDLAFFAKQWLQGT